MEPLPVGPSRPSPWSLDRRHPLVGLAFLALVLAGCPSNPDEEDSPAIATDGDADSTDTTAPDSTDPDSGPAPVCTAGAFDKCSPDFKGAVVCNEDGSGWETRQCLDDKGEPSICHKDYGGCLGCTPGKKRCLDDDTLEECNDESQWIPAQPCNGELTGQTCVDSQAGAACGALCTLAEKWNTYMGCTFWAVDLDNIFSQGEGGGVNDAGAAQFSVVVSNPDPKLPATIKVFDADGLVTIDSNLEPMPTDPLMPGELRILNLPRRDVNGTICAPAAYRIDASIPITAYQFNPLTNETKVYSNDASLLLPENVLEKWYIVVTREQTFKTARGIIAVVGTQSGETEVKVTVTARTLAGGPIPALEAGETATCVIGRHDVMNIESNAPSADLTGSVVLATRRVAVFGASECANVPNTARCTVAPGEEEGVCEWDGQSPCADSYDCLSFNTCCCDHLEDMLFPVKTWGTRYLCARTMPRNQEPDFWRIVAAKDNTVIETIPPQAAIPVLNAGEWFEFPSMGDFEISANHPVFVAHFMASEDSPDPNVNGIPQPGDANIGDPAMMFVVPDQQFRSDYVFLAPNAYAKDFVTLVAPTGSAVYLDGELVDDAEFSLFGSGEFSVARREITDGVHTVSSDDVVGVEVYGYDDWVSYGYAGGLDLKDLKLITEPEN